MATFLKTGHPYLPESPPVYYLYEKEQVAQLNPEILAIADPKAVDFFLRFPESLLEHAASAKAESFTRWLESLASKSCVLAIITSGLPAREGDGGSMLTFPDMDDMTAWEEWPHSGFALHFNRKLYNPDAVPVALQEFQAFGTIYFNEWCGSGSFPGHLGFARVYDDQDERFFWDEVIETSPDTPVQQFVSFLHDSGSHLIFDDEGSVWCGGFEEGDLWKSESTLEEVIENIFTTCLTSERPAPCYLAPRPEGSY
jgi:hypothetical protein